MSGTMTRDQIVTEVADIVGKSENAAAVSGAVLQTRIQTYLNWAQRRIARAYSFEELNAIQESASIIDGVKKYPLESGTNNLGLTRPKDIYDITLMDGENSRKLQRCSPAQFDLKFPQPTNYAEGRPSLYIRYGDQLEVFRIPDTTYTLRIRYPQWPTTFSSGSQTSDYTNKDELILVMTVVETYLALEEYADVAVWYPRALGLLTEAIGAETNVDWKPKGEGYTEERLPVVGEPWLDPSAVPEDPLYGYH